MSQPKVTCTRILKSDTGHRVLGHEGKCANCHGHEYKYEITAEAPLDTLGRVIDFSVIKDKVGKWINENWDHAFLVNYMDHALIAALDSVKDSKPPVILAFNPTAENIARHLIEVVCPTVLEGTNVKVTRVKVWETMNCFAEATLGADSP